MKKRRQLVQGLLTIRIPRALKSLQSIKDVSPLLFSQIRFVQCKFFEQTNPAAIPTMGKHRNTSKAQGIHIPLNCPDRHRTAFRQFLRCPAGSIHQEKNDLQKTFSLHLLPPVVILVQQASHGRNTTLSDSQRAPWGFGSCHYCFVQDIACFVCIETGTHWQR